MVLVNISCNCFNILRTKYKFIGSILGTLGERTVLHEW